MWFNIMSDGGLLCPYLDKTVGHVSPAHYIYDSDLKKYMDMFEEMWEETNN